MYEYKAHVLRVYDGDTIRVDIDLGLGVWVRNQSIRLLGINAPELRGDERPAGLRSAAALREFIEDEEVIIRTEKDKTGKYGRWLATVEMGNGLVRVNVNQWMIDKGYAVEYR